MDGNETERTTEGQASVETTATRPQDTGPERLDRKVCLLATVKPERALAQPLLQHLTDEVPEVQFTLEAREDVDAVWICGYEPGFQRLVRKLRERHPEAILVVTGREPVEDWESEVAAGGADFAFSWPVAYEILESVMKGGMPSKSLRARLRAESAPAE